MKRLALIFGLAFIACSAFAQNEADALRYSQYNHTGTARYNGMAGAFGALGGDPSVMSFNPAGLGVFKSKTITFSPSVKLTTDNADFMGTKTRDFTGNYFDINDVSIVHTIKHSDDGSGLAYINLGFSYTRLNRFNENTTIDGYNNVNSLTDWFAARAEGIHYDNLANDDPFYSSLAWETYLIDPLHDTIANSFVSPYDSYGERQRQIITKKGGTGDINFSAAINVAHKLFIGATLGLQDVTYKQTIITNEERDVNSGVKSFSFEDYLFTNGLGVNFKIGVIYAPVNFIRIGAAIHTPTMFTLTDSYNTYASTHIGDSTMSRESPDGSFEYQLTSPFRANGSLAFVIGKSFVIDADYEFVNYSKMNLRSDNYIFTNENQAIASTYKAGHNVKLGAEYRLGILNFRLGGAYYSSMYKNSSDVNTGTWIASCGLGIKTNGIFFGDIAYSYMTNSRNYYMYSYYIDSPETKINFSRHQISLTVGIRF